MVLSKNLKIAICFGLIMGTILSLCNLCFAAETVDYTIVNGVGISGSTGVIGNASSDAIGYFRIEPGYLYTVVRNDGYGFKSGFSNQTPVANLKLEEFHIAAKSTFTYSDYQYFYFNFSPVSADSYNITREPLQGMDNFVDRMAYSLSIGELSSVWVLVVPILAISVLLGLGFYLLKRLLNRIKRAKGGV